MAYVTVPKDLTRIKSKVLFGLTKRQLACFTPAVLLGVPLFFLLRGSMGTSAATLCMVLVMLPFFLLAMYEKNGEPLERFIGHFVRTKFTRPKERPYRTCNFYTALMRQDQLEKEVRAIVKKRNAKSKAEAHKGRKA
ncbi:PrgI family protein [Clostridium transplantifaecale]|uniref:PrgI family protein n=1 Tax=Clostridium transplantifaecale TaxID=2479838 RepID=UPI000F639C0E|nr:PrgI family protein [Clostridium transplantifaecale]